MRGTLRRQEGVLQGRLGPGVLREDFSQRGRPEARQPGLRVHALRHLDDCPLLKNERQPQAQLHRARAQQFPGLAVPEAAQNRLRSQRRLEQGELAFLYVELQEPIHPFQPQRGLRQIRKVRAPARAEQEQPPCEARGGRGGLQEAESQ